MVHQKGVRAGGLAYNNCIMPAAAATPCPLMYCNSVVALQVLSRSQDQKYSVHVTRCLQSAPAASVDDLLAPPEKLVRLLLERGVPGISNVVITLGDCIKCRQSDPI